MQIWGFPLELFGAILAFSIRLERKENYWWRMVWSVIGAVTLVVVLQAITNVAYRRIETVMEKPIFYTLFFGAVLLGLFICLIKIPYLVPVKEAIYSIACAYLVEHIAYCIRLMVNDFAGKSVADAGSIWYPLIHIAIYVLAYYYVAKPMIRGGHYGTSAVQSVGLLLATVFLVLVMSMVATIYQFEQIHAIYALFACVFVLYSQLKQQKQLNLQRELALQEQMWMKHKAQYEMSKETIDIINTKCHDLKHQVAALRTMNNLDAQKKVLDSIDESVMIYDAMIKTGNDILDTILTEKSLLCKQRKITLSCIADGSLMNFMDPIDLYSLLGNAVDNAMEAVEKVPEDMRSITFSIMERQGMILVQIENPYEGTIRLRDGIPVTNKKDMNYHGFGVHSMKSIVEKYHGFLTIETDNQVFVLRMSFTT